MARRSLSLILMIALLPAVAGCSRGTNAPDAPPPLSDGALAAVAQSPGVNREKLARAVDRLFDKEADETRAVIVMKNGRIVAERYGEGYHENTRFVSWSMAKSITGVMIGMLVSDGRLRLDETAPVPAWQRPGDPRGEITLRQLLQMRSGLRHSEAIEPVYESDEVRMLFLDGRDDMARYAEDQPLEAEPGRRFEYSTATSVILADLAARVLSPANDPESRRHAVAEYLRTRLFEPARMKSMLPEFDAAGTLVGGSLIHGTARDWAKFGEFLRNKGSVRGAQIIPRQWIEFMVTPSARESQYGAQIWLNRSPTSGDPALFPERGPKGLFACIGHLGQYVLVSPSRGLVIVRLGKTQDDRLEPVRERLADIVALYR
ncbi:beta-lactamase [Novosphingobium aromaticivorans DSM 12444]|uniref:Beta-lactamase n=1 Tax=Novosphingobium aromaticivorans (strain ATCC 700278 / DSM 12444 / CCUG 56034 / CIP 105152 / NBRC 16084 / F199) TaxID=279238 RepID=Q2G2Y9_NOVAD|nr:serine hydrolase [Novosphingobium aromaticivorans]ABD24494.1 beta-lactamase [Novosphingobium aromaticivorans DSM 12444]SCY26569.1 CubicO group peptidase, beta-lactamase class C family [Novosphingobium aromaticivorans]